MGEKKCNPWLKELISKKHKKTCETLYFVEHLLF